MINDTHCSSVQKSILLTALVGTFVLSYLPVWEKLVSAWSSSEEYSHGFLIIPICLCILWRKRDEIRGIPARPSSWGFGLVLLGQAIYIVAHLAKIVTVASVSMLLVLIGVVIYLYGYSVLKAVLFPLFLLLLMIPVPSQIYSSLTIPLQLFVSKTSVWLVSCFGIPVYREGNVIFIPEHTMQVVQACSGLRSMISLLTLSAILGYFSLRSDFLRSMLFIAAVPVSILVNIMRIMLLVLSLYWLDLDMTRGWVHTVVGILVFTSALILLGIATGVFSQWEKTRTGE